MGILQFILELISAVYRVGKKKNKRFKSKKAFLRARNRRLHKIFMARAKHIENGKKAITVEKLIRRSIRKGKKRAKMRWQQKVTTHSHTARIKELEQRKDTLRERIKGKKAAAANMWIAPNR